MYTALQRHAAEGCTVMVDPSRPHGTVSRTSVRVQFCSGECPMVSPWSYTYRVAHIAIQVARAALPKVVRTCQGQDSRRKVPPGRRFLGRKRCQYAIRRRSRPSIHLRSTFLPESVRNPLQDRVVAGQFRFEWRSSSAHQTRWDGLLLHTEAFLVCFRQECSV